MDFSRKVMVKVPLGKSDEAWLIICGDTLTERNIEVARGYLDICQEIAEYDVAELYTAHVQLEDEEEG